jgi:hypothetical protein
VPLVSYNLSRLIDWNAICRTWLLFPLRRYTNTCVFEPTPDCICIKRSKYQEEALREKRGFYGTYVPSSQKNSSLIKNFKKYHPNIVECGLIIKIFIPNTQWCNWNLIWIFHLKFIVFSQTSFACGSAIHLSCMQPRPLSLFSGDNTKKLCRLQMTCKTTPRNFVAHKWHAIVHDARMHIL